MNPQYLGDGVYISDGARWNNDRAVYLTTGHHLVEQADNVIYLETDVLDALINVLRKENRIKGETTNGN
jgi:hypothetical protein